MNEPVQRNALPNFSGLLPKSSLCFLLWHQPEPANLNKECERERDFDRCPRLVNELVCSKISSSCTLRYFILHWCFLFVLVNPQPSDCCLTILYIKKLTRDNAASRHILIIRVYFHLPIFILPVHEDISVLSRRVGLTPAVVGAG